MAANGRSVIGPCAVARLPVLRSARDLCHAQQIMPAQRSLECLPRRTTPAARALRPSGSGCCGSTASSVVGMSNSISIAVAVLPRAIAARANLPGLRTRNDRASHSPQPSSSALPTRESADIRETLLALSRCNLNLRRRPDAGTSSSASATMRCAAARPLHARRHI